MSQDTQEAAGAQLATRGLTGLTYDEFEIGAEYWSPGRTVTETDLVSFSALSGDWNPHHTDALFAANSQLGQRIAHGALVVAISTGLFVRLRVFEQTIIALLEWHYKFVKPVFIGTRLQLRVRVIDKRETKKPTTGIVTFEVATIDEADDPTAIAEWKMLVTREAA